MKNKPTTSIDTQLQQRIDQLIMETGEYSPLELLLAEGRLLYNDYEAWLNGDIEYLEDVLFGDPEHIKTALQQAHAYLVQMPMLQAQTLSQATAHRSPVKPFSRNERLDTLFWTHFKKAEDQPQMDLFVDGGAGNLINGIILALAQSDYTEARRLLEQLYDTQPDNTKLADLETLVQYGESTDKISGSADELEYLQSRLAPLAQAHLGQRSRDYLVPHWRRLTNALTTIVFDPALPERHASYTAIQALDWAAAKQAIEQEPAWRQSSVLLQRHVQACSGLWQQSGALLSWFYLCWQFPEDTEIAAVQGDNLLKEAWLEFLELEPELSTSTFPAWYLLKKPGLVKTLPDPEGADSMPCDVPYKIIYRMQTITQAQGAIGPEQDIELRQQLQQADPVFFRHFIGRI